ncbi:hypothetical protein C8R46DRAFT_904184 [Mycena filopes]|nr:hypothetical protein C8R46DRAFT_904184 [Mycena filopes]
MAAVAPPEAQEGEEDWDGEYEEEEDDADLAAEAAEVARRLEAQLWADIKASGTPAPIDPPAVEKPPNAKQLAAIQTVRAILASLEHDPLAHSTLAGAKIPEFAGDTLLAILHNMAASGTIPAGVARPISRFLISLAESAPLFAALRHSAAPAQTLKRKREEEHEGERVKKRAFVGAHPLFVALTEAARGVEGALQATAAPLGLPPALAPHLHRVALFAASAATVPANPHAATLQEISGLVQVLGVLSGIQIGVSNAKNAGDAEAKVHPCLVAGCGKVFARRAHAHKAGSPPSDAGEGELDVDVITAAQTVVLALHAPLQTHVARALAASSASGAGGAPATNGQATLASVIAAAQAQAQAQAKAPAEAEAEGDVDAEGEEEEGDGA